MAETPLLDTPYETLRKEQEASWDTWGPHSEGVRGLLFARGHMWEVDGTDWRFEVVGVWTPDAFIEEHRSATGPWGEAVAWLRQREGAAG